MLQTHRDGAGLASITGLLDTWEGRRYHRATFAVAIPVTHPLDVESIQARLSDAPIGHRILSFLSVASTMDVARREAEQAAAEGTVVVAQEQTAGRGRFGRSWVSRGGQDLTFSVLLYPSRTASAGIGIAASVAVMRAVRQVTDLSPSLKWPNDVLLAGKKVCGILIETALQEYEVRYAILGLGINVNSDPAADPEIAPVATSLARELGHQVSREALLEAVLLELGRVYCQVTGWAETWEAWHASLETLGKRVQVRWGEQVEEGLAEAVDAEGNLLLRRQDGTLITLPGGEVTFQVP